MILDLDNFLKELEERGVDISKVKIIESDYMDEKEEYSNACWSCGKEVDYDLVDGLCCYECSNWVLYGID